MSFGNFLRKLSFETDKQQAGGELEETRENSAVNSILNAPGKLLSSMNIKTGNLVSDLNQKLDLSGKLDTLKHASVNKFESVLHGTGSIKEASPTTTNIPDLFTRIPHVNPFNEKQSERVDCQPDRRESESTNVQLRRQSTNVGPKPPRPPPPSVALLNRAISLDESNLTRASYKPATVAPRMEPSSEVEEERQPHAAAKDSCPWSTIKQSDSAKVHQEEDAESSASEYGNQGDKPVYKSDEDESQIQSNEPESIENKMESAPENLNLIVENLVPAILNGSFTGNSKYENELLNLFETCAGRLSFVNKIEQEAIKTQGILQPEVLPLLLETLCLLLNKCQEAEDFSPAKKLLTTSLLLHIPDPSNPDEQTFLFAYIKTQPIWQTLRFWNACFFQSLQEARAKVADQIAVEKTMQEIAYDQLKSYLSTMNAFNLHSTIKHEFLRKQSGLFNLTDDEVRSLQSIVIGN